MTEWPGQPVQASPPAQPQWPGQTVAAPKTDWPGQPVAVQKPSAPKIDVPKPSAPAPAPAQKPDLWQQANAAVHDYIPSAADLGSTLDRRAKESAAAFKEDFTTSPTKAGTKPRWFDAPIRGGKTALDVLGYPFQPVAAVGEEFVGRPYQKAAETVTGKKLPGAKSAMGDALTIFTPLGEAKAAKSVVKGVQEAAKPVVKGARELAEAPKPSAEPSAMPTPQHEAVGPIVGHEPDVKTRVDNSLYRLGGHATADKLEAKEFFKSLPKEVKDPKVQERLYTEIEKKLVDPAHEIPEDLKPAMEAMRPMYEEQTKLVNEIRARNDPDLEPFLEDAGYVARRVKGYSPAFDSAAEGPTSGKGNVITGQGAGGKRALGTSAQALKSRTAGEMATDAKGETHFWPGKAPETDKLGQPYAKVRQATSAEVEANTQVRYHKNAVVNTVDNVLRLRRVKRNLEVLDLLKDQMKEQGLAHQKEWHFKNSQGQWVRAQSNKPTPEGFVELPNIPQLKGWAFDPKIADILKDYYPGKDEPLDNILTKANRALTASLFITPIPHLANVGAHWAVGRGWDWMSAPGYARLMKTGTKAALEVLSGGPEYRRMLREGSGLMYGDVGTKNFYEAMMGKATQELTEDPKAVSALNRAFKVNLNPVEWGKALYAASNKTLWAGNDIFLLQRQLELERRGLSTRKAIFEAEKDIPNYRIPSQVMGSRWAAQALKSPNLMMFGRYKYGQIKAWGSMFEEAFKGDAKGKADAVGKFIVALALANVAYPLADQALKKASGNKDARVKRAGPFSLSDAAWQLTTGQKDWAVALSSLINPSPVIETGMEARQNKDFFGRDIIQKGAAPAQAGVEAGEYAVGKWYPGQLAMEMTKPGGAAQAFGQLGGLELPPPGSKARAAVGKERALKAGKKKAARDPLYQKLKGLVP